MTSFFPLLLSYDRQPILTTADPCSTHQGPGEEKNDYETNHALWNQYDMPYLAIFFMMTSKPSINFLLQKKKSAVGLSE